jgi:cysteine-S-conjugate beta-lyase
VLTDLTEDQLRAASPLKWGEAPPGVLAAWVAETDFALAEPVAEALRRAVCDGVTGYPPDDAGSSLGAAFAGFAGRHWGWQVSPDQVVSCVDVMSGVRLVLETVAPPGPVVMPTPAYPPFLQITDVCRRERIDLPLDPDQDEATIDLDRLDDAFAAGARTLLLCNPHNPWGRVFTLAELMAIDEVVRRHDGFVIADEIHAPLALDGRTHVPYLSLPTTSAYTVAAVSASKAFNVAGLKCAQLVATDPALLSALRSVPLVANHSVSPLGVVASVAAYQQGDGFLDAQNRRLADNAELFAAELAAVVPLARARPLEGTYLAWIDLRAYGFDRPAHQALEAGKVFVFDGHHFGAGGAGHVRANLGTSPARVSEIVRRLGSAMTARSEQAAP